MNFTADVLVLLTSVITLATLILNTVKTYQVGRGTKRNTIAIAQVHTSADGARGALHNHLAMIEAAVKAMAEASAKAKEQ